MGAQQATHERLTSDEATRGASDRGFGLVFAVVFAIIGLWPLMGDGPIRIWACVAAAAFLAVAVTRPRILAPLNRLWTRIGLFLHRVASFVVLGLLFYLMITPIGVARRMLGRDPLRLRLEPGTRSYWIERQPPGPKPDSIKYQF